MGSDTPSDTPPDISKLGGCHPKTGGVLTPPRGGLQKSLFGPFWTVFSILYRGASVRLSTPNNRWGC